MSDVTAEIDIGVATAVVPGPSLGVERTSAVSETYPSELVAYVCYQVVRLLSANGPGDFMLGKQEVFSLLDEAINESEIILESE